MRRIILCSVLVMICFITTNVYAYGIAIENADGVTIYYNYINNGEELEVTYKVNPHYMSSYSGDIVIPSSVTYQGVAYNVTSIGNEAFAECSGLTSVKIPNSITSIGSFSFDGCTELTSVNIPNSVKSIGGYAFNRCIKLTSVYIPNSITTLEDGLFSCCSSLASVTIPNSITNMGDGLFSYCSSLTSVNIPNSVKSIGGYAFTECSNLTSVNIPNSVTSIGNYAFDKCSSLTNVDIPNSMTSIGNGLFSNCSSLNSVNIPNTVTSIGSEAFSGCSSLTSVNIPNSVKSIGHSAFSSCNSLTSVIIPNSVTSIESFAFSHCTALTSVTIPESVTSIGNYAFSNCYGLKSVSIPNSVTSIGEAAFAGCKGLTSVNIPNSVTGIGKSAFSGCEALASAIIPNSVTSLEEGVFGQCRSLTSVTIPNSVSIIGNHAFSGCSSLPSVIIPNSVTSIGEYAFFECSNLTSVIIPNSVTSIGAVAFGYCSGLTSINIPESVTSIGISAFRNCSGLTSITIPKSVSSFGNYAFFDCTLESVYSLIEDPHEITGRDSVDRWGNYHGTFSVNTFENAMLYVPANSIDKYKLTKGWKDFAHIQSLEFSLSGTVRDQDGNPIAGAQVTLANGTYYQTSTTDADGHYQVEVEDKEKEYVVSAHAYGHTSITEGPIICPAENDVCDLVLYNALNYQAGKRYTIVLPIAPDASAGRYFRLDRVEGGNIIFEREYSPQADVPYVFYPNKDFRIDLREMDLSKEATTTKIIVTHDGVGSRDAAYFMGSYSYMRSFILEVDTPVYFDDDDQGDNSAGLYHIDAMHATLLWNWHAFDKPFQPSYEAPSFVFHDPEEDISPYRHFFEEGKVWKVGKFNLAWDIWAIESHYFEGDTIVGGYPCKKMMEAYDLLSTGYHTESYVGAIYEDGRRVYCAWPDRNWFFLLYDFASIEDCNISFFDFDFKEAYPIKGHILSKSFRQDEKFHGWTKTFAEATTTYDGITYEDAFDWMEGVGYQGFYNFVRTDKNGYYRELISCTVGDEVLYYDAALAAKMSPANPSEVKKQWLDFTHTVKTRPKAPERSLTPNPSPVREGSQEEETLTGEYSLKELFVNFKPLAGPYVITICDDSGTEVYRKEVQTSNVIGLNTDISGYEKGEYTITVENEEEAYTAEFKIDDETGINRPTPAPSLYGGEKAGAWYDLSGRKVSPTPAPSPVRAGKKLPRGVYIKDRRKVVVK